MRASTIARNYADALYELGEQEGQTERYGDLMDALADAIRVEPRIRVVLESPRVSKPTKVAILDTALHELAPETFRRFLGAVVRRNRQTLLPAIADQLQSRVDDKFGRAHAWVTLAREPNQALKTAVRHKLGEAIGKEIIAHYRTDPEILGGLIVRLGDRIMDGSLRRRVVALRRRMLG